VCPLSLHVEKFVASTYEQNCYVLANGDGEALIVDPGSNAGRIIETIDKKGWRPLAVIATHAHFDHVGAVAEVMERYSVPFYLHHSDKALLRRMNLYNMVIAPEGPALRVPKITHDLAKMVSPFDIGGFVIDTVLSPGHTPGGVCFLIDGNIFTGDTLLPKGVGRTDLPGGDAGALLKSLDCLAELSGELDAHPGHGFSMPLGLLLEKAKTSGAKGCHNT
jgi:hydroxyacylglutathione hydrolase